MFAGLRSSRNKKKQRSPSFTNLPSSVSTPDILTPATNITDDDDDDDDGDVNFSVNRKSINSKRINKKDNDFDDHDYSDSFLVSSLSKKKYIDGDDKQTQNPVSVNNGREAQVESFLKLQEELLNSVNSMDSLNFLKKKMLASLINSTFQLFQSKVGKDKRLIDLQDPKLFDSLQSVVDSLISVLLTISTTEYSTNDVLSSKHQSNNIADSLDTEKSNKLPDEFEDNDSENDIRLTNTLRSFNGLHAGETPKSAASSGVFYRSATPHHIYPNSAHKQMYIPSQSATPYAPHQLQQHNTPFQHSLQQYPIESDNIRYNLEPPPQPIFIDPLQYQHIQQQQQQQQQYRAFTPSVASVVSRQSTPYMMQNSSSQSRSRSRMTHNNGNPNGGGELLFPYAHRYTDSSVSNANPYYEVYNPSNFGMEPNGYH